MVNIIITITIQRETNFEFYFMLCISDPKRRAWSHDDLLL